MLLTDLLGPEQLKTLEDHLEPVSFAEQECLFLQGDDGTECFILDEGRIRLELDIPNSDMHVTLGFLEPGHLLGEFCLLDEGLRSASAYAEDAVAARKLSRERFLALCDEHPELGTAMLTYFSRELIRKTRTTNEKLEEFLSKILEHYPGLLFVIDARGSIGNHISGKVRDIYGNVQGRNVAEVLYQDNPEVVESFNSALGIALADETTCEEFMKDLTESLIRVGDVSFDLSYYVAASHGGEVDSLLMLGVDVTRELEEKRRAEEASSEAQLITSVAKDIQGFLSFQQESRKILDSLNPDELQIDSRTVDGVFRGIHTVKGSAASYALYRVVSIAHELEAHLGELRDLLHSDATARVAKKDLEATRRDTKKLVEVLEGERSRLCELFQLSGRDVVRVDREQLRDVIERGLPADEAFTYLSLPTFREFITSFAEKTLESARAALAAQGKEKDLRCSASVDDRKLSREGRALLEKVLSHLLRNAADHAIEESAEREMLGKPAFGTVTIEQGKGEGGLVGLTVRDDGQGIDTAAVLAKARKQGMAGGEEPSSRQEVYEYLFHPGFSTKGGVSSVSGRGVGLDAVRYLLEEAGGSIEVDSKETQGTTFYISIPEKILFL